MPINTNLIYNLKPKAGDTSPLNEVTGSNALAGGTIALVNVGGTEQEVWQFSGSDSSAIGVSKSMVMSDAAGGFTMAVRMRTTTFPTVDFTRLLQFFLGTDANCYVGIARDGSNSVRVRFTDTTDSGSTVSLGAGMNSWHTYVLKVSTNGAGQEKLEIWRDTGVTGTRVADFISATYPAVATTYDKLLVGCQNSAVVQIDRWVIFSDEKTGAECSLLVEDINGSVDGTPDVLVGSSSTFGMIGGTGAISITPATGGTVNLAGSSATFGMVGGTGNVGVTSPPGTITSDEFRNFSNILQTSVTIPVVPILKMDGTLAVTLTNQVTNGAGKLVITNAALTVGTSYMLGSWDTADSNPDTMKRGLKKVTAA